MKPSRRPRRIAFFGAWSFITRPNMPVGSTWLKSEIGVLRGLMPGSPHWRARNACVTLKSEEWQRQRNVSGDRIKWKFTTQKARDKLARAYPDIAKES